MVLIHRWFPIAWLDKFGLCFFLNTLDRGGWKMFSVSLWKPIYIDVESWRRESFVCRPEGW